MPQDGYGGDESFPHDGKQEDAAVARATVGMIMMAKSKEGGKSGTI